jgi:hypothetical protein
MSKFSSPTAAKLSSSLVPMANKEIVPYGFDLSKKPIALALTVIPLEVTPIRSSQSYFAQAIHRPVLTLLPPCPLLKDKPRQQEPKLDVQKLFNVMKEINILPLKGHKVLTRVKTNKFGDVTCAKYKSVTPCTTIDGVQAMLDYIKVVPQRRGKGRHHHHLS